MNHVFVGILQPNPWFHFSSYIATITHLQYHPSVIDTKADISKHRGSCQSNQDALPVGLNNSHSNKHFLCVCVCVCVAFPAACGNTRSGIEPAPLQ